MEEVSPSESQSAAAAVAAAAAPPRPSPPPPSAPADDEEEQESNNEDESLLEKAQALMDKITSSPDNPNPNVIHALSSILETQESRYMEETGHLSLNNTRASHNVGRLGSLIRENDEFFELISSKFLSEARYPASIQAATTRLLFSCSLTWMYPHVFEETVLENIKGWVMDETARSSGEDRSWKHETGKRKSSDSEMLKTYSTGLLAVCLVGGGQGVEDVVTSGLSALSAKLMRYLRIQALGEASQKDAHYLAESKNASVNCVRVRDEGRGRFWQVPDTSHLDPPRIMEEGLLDESSTKWTHDSSQACADECGVQGGEPPDSLAEGHDTYEEVGINGEDRWHGQDLHDGRTNIGDRNCPARSGREEDFDESIRDESSRRRVARGLARSRGKGRVNEVIPENEQGLISPGSGSRLGTRGRIIKERSLNRSFDVKRLPDPKKSLGGVSADSFVMEREDNNDDCFKECKVGTKDISDLVRKAVQAAEAEAIAASAPAEAVKAACDAAAEVVKSAASEELKRTGDEEAAVLSASIAASTVIDAASAIEMSRSSIGVCDDSIAPNGTEPEPNEEAEEFFILDIDSLAKLREKFCIQCLVILGEYVEVLGPVLHEKGVDVCLALLQRNSKQIDESKIAMLLPDVLKLICTLAAHRKFAALFVDRGGMQRLLAVPRIAQTFFGLSSCLYAIGSLQGIMERVCALPSDVVQQVVELGLQLLGCPQDQARKNAALFLSNAFVFRAVLDSFDAQDGLQKSLSPLHDAASVRSGVNSGALGPSSSGPLRNDRSPPEVLTSSEKQIAYHTCVALRQYFRAHLLLLVDSIRPNKNNRSAVRNIPNIRAAYKPLDISNEAMDAIFRQLQKDRKLGPAFVRVRWPAVDKFLASNGHIIMLEFCQAPTVDRYLHDLLQYALGVLHIVTLVPYSRKPIVNATLSNDRIGVAVILDAANGAGYVEPEIIQPALNVLVNLVCPPPSISNKPPLITQVQQSASVQTLNGPSMESRNAERNISDRVGNMPVQNELRERNGESSAADRGSSLTVGGTTAVCNTSQTSVTSGLVGDRRISLGAGAGCAGLAAQLEQGYRQAREVVRANNGIKVLLQLLQSRIVAPPAALDCLRALACRVLLGLARDDAIAHILTKLQVGKKLSELIRDSGSQTTGNEHSRWQAELAQVAIELIAIVTNSGRASTLAATDAATPTLRRIERAAIAAATPITYHSRELLLLIHEHLQASGLSTTADVLLKEAQLTPLPSLAAPSSLVHQSSGQDSSSIQIQWPSGRIPGGFFFDKQQKPTSSNGDSSVKCETDEPTSKKKPLFSPTLNLQSRSHPPAYDSPRASSSKIISNLKKSSAPEGTPEPSSIPAVKPILDTDIQFKTPIILPMKRKFMELKDMGLGSSVKQRNTCEHGLRSPACVTPNTARRSCLLTDVNVNCSPSTNVKDHHGRLILNNSLAENLDDNQCNTHLGPMTPSTQFGFLSDSQPINIERLTLDSLVVQYLKHQHRQCPAPITTLPPLSLLHPHVCPEPRRSLDVPSNVTARLSTREFRSNYGGIHGSRRDRQFVYSRFRPWRTCRDGDGGDRSLLTCVTFLGDSSQIAAGSHSGELKIFDSNSNNVLESCASHQSPLTLVQSYLSGETQLILSSSAHDVRLWDASSVSGGPKHPFEGCKAARFSNSGTIFAALSSEQFRREILLYDIQSCHLDMKLTDPSSTPLGRVHVHSTVHFSPSDTMLLWNGVLWDGRVSCPVHRFDQFTDYGGGGFHPAGNEVIINSEVWDLRKFRLLRSVPSLDQTVITFNASGDVIYAILRRNLEDVTSAFHTRRVKHSLFDAFRTVDAVNYSDIATIPVDRCVLDFATEPTDSFVGLVTMDDQEEMYSSARVYEIGRRRPTDDDSDPDGAESEEEEDDDDDEEDIDEDPLLGPIDGDGDSADDTSNDDDDSLSDLDEDEEDANFIMDGDFGPGGGILEIVTDGEDDDSQMVESLSSGDEGDFAGFVF
ncbi:DDB1- and CUL4-associated factor homolog 1 [Diospyros lotus]|uniref:DDB1- and CUL4-associated factor homolog 1 n=1 Tax=Diospyros lotus TaxID=55363 RepID=UPI002253DF7C|nr:DDB1- and CUL4-associated factor homolog 1 [Diospyros lotus]